MSILLLSSANRLTSYLSWRRNRKSIEDAWWAGANGRRGRERGHTCFPLVMISAFRRPFSRLTTLNHDMPRTQTLDLDLRPSRCLQHSRSSQRSRHPRSSRPSGNPRCSRRSPPITHHDLLSTPATRTHSIQCARTSFSIAHRPTAVCAWIMFVGAW